MAAFGTYDDLFGKKESTPRRPSQPKWENPGDTHTGVISGEPELVDEMAFDTNGRPTAPKFMVKTGEGKSGWQVKAKGAFDEELDNFPLKQIAIPVLLSDGTPSTWYFSTKDEKLKDAMQETGLPIAEGVTIARRLLRLDGRKKVWSVKLAR